MTAVRYPAVAGTFYPADRKPVEANPVSKLPATARR
jgi:hypothetical protein